MRKHVEESAATGAAAGRGRGGRFSAGRKREVVMRLLRGRISSPCRGRWRSRRRGGALAGSVSGCGAGGPQEPRDGVVSMAWFEYLRCRAWLPARAPRRVPVGELAIGESEPDGQTPASAETRLVLPPIPDTVGLLDVLPLGALETRHAGPRISGWRAIIDRDRELVQRRSLLSRSGAVYPKESLNATKYIPK